ncbi:hypothetical protein GYB29_03855 [bacterium]|nr:hypothetical protein [bacterium]
MIKSSILIFISFIWVTIDLLPAHSQFINLRLKIEPELNVSVEQSLDFGNVVSNSGYREVQLGDVRMGVFSIRAYYTQNIQINISVPQELININPAITERIPLQLEASYNNSGLNNINNAVPLTNNQGLISIYDGDEHLATSGDVWQEMFLYVYGGIDVGNIPNGIYTAEVVVSVTYE